ncbi:predicted protein [Nematostella vectensis]|uniref:Uncharacterized protein n=1 Tax=Nematostella vectensis TaxID=45351 RepID=A7RVV0_NEMVE|nr:predicted protein [Nematostella vectensis]|eukprot:XP_001636578.1 predicted protein [Nematostella vectensis]
MKEYDSVPPPSQSEPQRPTTTAQRLRTTEQNQRPLESRGSTAVLDERASYHGRHGAVRSARLTSLSALYQPAFKPYSFSHMYDTKYNNDFQGRYRPPPSPTRPESTNYAPIDYRFNDTTYKQHFQSQKPLTLPFVVPYSRHRKNNPHPQMRNTYNYPDTSRWIWSAPNQPQQQQGAPSGRNPYRYHRWCSR